MAVQGVTSSGNAGLYSPHITNTAITAFDSALKSLMVSKGHNLNATVQNEVRFNGEEIKFQFMGEINAARHSIGRHAVAQTPLTGRISITTDDWVVKTIAHPFQKGITNYDDISQFAMRHVDAHQRAHDLEFLRALDAVPDDDLLLVIDAGTADTQGVGGGAADADNTGFRVSVTQKIYAAFRRFMGDAMSPMACCCVLHADDEQNFLNILSQQGEVVLNRDYRARQMLNDGMLKDGWNGLSFKVLGQFPDVEDLDVSSDGKRINYAGNVKKDTATDAIYRGGNPFNTGGTNADALTAAQNDAGGAITDVGAASPLDFSENRSANRRRYIYAYTRDALVVARNRPNWHRTDYNDDFLAHVTTSVTNNGVQVVDPQKVIRIKIKD